MFLLKRACGVVSPQGRKRRFRRVTAYAVATLAAAEMAVPAGSAGVLSPKGIDLGPRAAIAAAPQSLPPMPGSAWQRLPSRKGGTAATAAVAPASMVSRRSSAQGLEAPAPATSRGAQAARLAVRVLIAISAVLLTIAGLGLLLPVLAGLYLVLMGVGVAVLEAVRRRRVAEAEADGV